MLQNRQMIRKLANVFLAGFLIFAETEWLYAFSFKTVLPYVFFLFTFAVLEDCTQLHIKEVFRRITLRSLIRNLVILAVLYRYYTFYEHKIYAVIWFAVMTAVLLLSDILIPERRIPKEYIAAACLMAVLTGTGYSFENSQMGDSLRRILVNILFLSTAWFLLFLRCFLIGEHLLEGLAGRTAASKDIRLSFEKKKAARCFAICFVMNIAVWFPAFLAMYPSVFNSDPLDQMQQILGITPYYSNHHSWYFTLLIELWYRIGYFLSGTVNGGIAMYTLFSMVFTSTGFALAVTFLYKKGLPWYLTAFVQILFALDPIKAHHTMAAWKDIPFAALLLIFAVVLAEFQISGKWLAAFWATGLAVCLLRNNGIYLFLILLPFFFIVCRENKKFFCKAYVPVLLAWYLFVKLLVPAAGVRATGLVESLSIPLQQVAYTVCEEGNISEEEYHLISQLAKPEEIKETYHNWNAGHMKHLVSPKEEIIRQNKGQYLKLWAGIGIKNPYCYLKAYVEQTKGYWYPSECLPVRVGQGITGEAIGMEKRPLWISQETADKIDHFTWTYGSEIYPKYFCLGLWTYLCLFIIAFLIKWKSYWMAVMPALLNIVTLLIAAPLNGDFKYGYPTYCFIPFGIGLLFLAQIRKPPENAAYRKILYSGET